MLVKILRKFCCRIKLINCTPVSFTLFKRDSGSNLITVSRYYPWKWTAGTQQWIVSRMMLLFNWVMFRFLSPLIFQGGTLIPPPLVPNCNSQRLMRYQTKTKMLTFWWTIRGPKKSTNWGSTRYGEKKHVPSIEATVGAVSSHDPNYVMFFLFSKLMFQSASGSFSKTSQQNKTPTVSAPTVSNHPKVTCSSFRRIFQPMYLTNNQVACPP